MNTLLRSIKGLAKLRQTGDSWRVDETYVKVKIKWMYLHRAVDRAGATIDFYLSPHRDQLGAARFLKKCRIRTTQKRRVPAAENTAAGQAMFIESLFGMVS
jgi:transposase-like protein